MALIKAMGVSAREGVGVGGIQGDILAGFATLVAE
jgi:hypothetical protein